MYAFLLGVARVLRLGYLEGGVIFLIKGSYLSFIRLVENYLAMIVLADLTFG